jgi:hypothetical protein
MAKPPKIKLESFDPERGGGDGIRPFKLRVF